MTANSYKNNFEMTADNFRDVIGIFNFFAFQIPVKVSTNIANPTRNKIPDIGKKNAPTTASNFVNDNRMFASNIYNCNFINFYFQIFQSPGMSRTIQARRHQASRTKLLRNTLRRPFHKLQQKTLRTMILNAYSYTIICLIVLKIVIIVWNFAPIFVILYIQGHVHCPTGGHVV